MFRNVTSVVRFYFRSSIIEKLEEKVEDQIKSTQYKKLSNSKSVGNFGLFKVPSKPQEILHLCKLWGTIKKQRSLASKLARLDWLMIDGDKNFLLHG